MGSQCDLARRRGVEHTSCGRALRQEQPAARLSSTFRRLSGSRSRAKRFVVRNYAQERRRIRRGSGSLALRGNPRKDARQAGVQQLSSVCGEEVLVEGKQGGGGGSGLGSDHLSFFFLQNASRGFICIFGTVTNGAGRVREWN